MRWLLVLALVVSCRAPHVAAPARPTSLLRHVPADTPYFYGMLEPPPPAITMQMMKALRPMLRRQFSLERQRDRSPFWRLYLAFLDELGDFSPDTLETLGIGARPVLVIYGHGLWPVARWHIADPKRAAATVARVVEHAGNAAAAQRMGSVTYYTLAVDSDTELAFGVAGGDLVATLLPPSQANAVLPFVVGDKLPERSLSEDQVAKIGAAHDLTRNAIGWIDLARFAAMFLDVGDPLRLQLASVGSDLPAPTADCRTEIGMLADAAPKIVFGTSRLDGRVMAANFDLELSPAALALVNTLAVELPPVPPSLGGILAGSGGVNTTALVAYSRFHRFTCDLLRDTGEELDRDLRDLEEIQDVKSMSVLVKKIEAMQVVGLVVFVAQDPLDLMKKFENIFPGLAGVTLSDDGHAVPWVSGLPIGKTVLALKGQAIGAAAGEGMDRPLEQILAAKPDPPAFLHLRMDPVRLFGSLKPWFGDALAKAWAGGELRFDLVTTSSSLRLHYEADLPESD